MIYVLLGNGFEELEALAPVDVLRRCGAQVKTVGVGGREITGGHGIPVMADCTVEEIDQNELEMIVVPGGLGGVASIKASPAAMSAIEQAWKNDKYVAAICAGPTVLAELGITEGRKCTSYPGTGAELPGALYQEDRAVVIDGRLITSRGPATAVEFALALAGILCGDAAADQTAVGMLVK